MVAVYFEPAAVIVVLVLLGQVLELRARDQTESAIRRSVRSSGALRESTRVACGCPHTFLPDR